MDEIQVNTIIHFLFIFSFSRKKYLSLLSGVDQFYLCIPTHCYKTSVNIAGLFFVCEVNAFIHVPLGVFLAKLVCLNW